MSVTVTNTGKVPGAEVVQLYVNDVYSSITTPVKALKGFEKVHLVPGQTKLVEFTLGPRELAFLDRHMEWVVEPGDFEIFVGRLKCVLTVAGETPVRRKGGRKREYIIN